MKRAHAGFGLLEVLIAVALMALAAMAGVTYITRGTQHSEWLGEKVFARQRALSILAELRAYVEGGAGEVAADLDGFDDGLGYEAALTIEPDPLVPGSYVAPGTVISGNIRDSGQWRWFRQISVRPFPGAATRDLRICTVKVYRLRPGDTMPGERMAEVSSVIRTSGDAFPTTQVYDVFLVAAENVPGWWVFMDAIQPFIEATLTDLEGRNPGLKFRTHWITTLGYGRDDEYAPYTNETRDSRDDTPWTYCYPGRMPSGQASERYYVPERMHARVNRDGVVTPTHVGGWAAQETYTDTNGNGQHDAGEPFVDTDGDGYWDVGNQVPYALADMNNHCMRYPDAVARHDARVKAGLATDDTLTWRLLLDRMVLDPDRYHNALIVNLHGELLPMPPSRNYSDAASVPELRPGWRVVAHPERIAPRRVAGNDALSIAPRFRVHAYKTEFAGPAGSEVLMTQEEPFLDANKNGAFDAGETYLDWNGNGQRDAGLAATLVIPGADYTAAPNAGSNPSILIQRLPGGIDADGNGSADAYRALESAVSYPEVFTDANADGIRQVAETFFDLDGNGTKDAYDPHQELDGDGTYSAVSETLTDADGDGQFDPARPAEPYTDANGTGRWDAAEPYWDYNKNGVHDGPTVATPPAWVPWNTADYGNAGAESAYVANYGEPFLDLDGDKIWDAAEAFFDADQDGVRDGGFERGEMWYSIRYDAAAQRTVLALHGTPLEAPQVGTQGLPATYRLYDLDYVPCPTPNTAADTNRFTRDLAWSGSTPKNTARWIVSLPSASIRKALETAAGAADGDAVDRLVTVETRIGDDLTTGVMWPARNEPRNLSRTYAWYYANAQDVPFSERHQINGDPRHCPYADTDATGTTAAHGYNWYWDNFSDGTGNQQGQWLAFDAARLRDRWKGAAEHDIGRLYQWLRQAVVHSEALWNSLTGFSFYYLSMGGDVGYDSANGYANSIPMDGKPFGLAGDVYENTITTAGGTASILGSRKLVRTNNGAAAGIRAGGYWWSKPWLGELCPDADYAAQWKAWGNLRANTGGSAGEFHLVRKDTITSSQQPLGTTMLNSTTRTGAEGCTSFFNIGTSGATFHHQYRDGMNGALVEDGPQLSAEYNFPLPTSASISRPFQLNTNWSGGVGDEFNFTDAYPRFSGQLVRRYYDHDTSPLIGSGMVRLQEPGATPRGGYVVVSGIDRTTASGSSFIARYSLLSLIHSFFGGGLPATPNRIEQLPRLAILGPTLITELDDPATIPVQWSVEWRRWDGKKYTQSFADAFTESESALVYMPLYSRDNGKTWLSMLNDTVVESGRLPWLAGVGPDPALTLTDGNPGGDETYNWSVPTGSFPQGSYLIRIEAFRVDEPLHYTQHMEKIYVNR